MRISFRQAAFIQPIRLLHDHTLQQGDLPQKVELMVLQHNFVVWAMYIDVNLQVFHLFLLPNIR